MPPGKGIALAILAKKPEKKADDEDYEGVEMAMQDLKEALDSDDFKAAAEAFRNAMDLCDSAEMDEE